MVTMDIEKEKDFENEKTIFASGHTELFPS